MQVTPEELATLIGLKDIEIMLLQKTVKAQAEELEKLRPQEPKLEAVK